jgi:hypothetical protein
LAISFPIQRSARNEALALRVRGSSRSAHAILASGFHNVALASPRGGAPRPHRVGNPIMLSLLIGSGSVSDAAMLPPKREQQLLHFVGRSCRAEIVALNLSASFRPQFFELILGLDAFGGGRDAETFTQGCHGPHDGDAVLPIGEVANEGLVDLDLVEWITAQIAQR